MLPASSTDYTALLARPDERWNAMAGDGAPTYVTYSFDIANVDDVFASSGVTGYGPMSAAQQADVRRAMAEFEAVTGLRFIAVDDPADAAITLTNASAPRSDLQGISNLPRIADQSAIDFTDMSSNGVLAMTVGTSGAADYSPGTRNFQTLLHELGHAVGLRHPNGTPEDPAFDTSTTVMSYNDSGANISTLQPLDVQALQQIYGATTGFDDHIAIWDEAADRFTLTGTAGDDVLIATDTDSVLTGGAGDDALYGRDGDDTFIPGAGNATVQGGTGADTLVLGGTRAQYTIAIGSDRRSVILTGTGAGTEEGVVTAAQIDSFAFADTTVTQDSLIAAYLPDLRVSGGTDVPTLSAGTPSDVTVSVQNTGGMTSGGFDVAVYLSTDATYDLNDVEIGRTAVATVDADATLGGITITLDPRFDIPAGDYTLIYIADADNDVVERFEFQNSFAPDTPTRYDNTAPQDRSAPYDIVARQDLPGDVDTLFATAIYQGTLRAGGASAFTFTNAATGIKATFTGTGFSADTAAGTVTGLRFTAPGFIDGQPADLSILGLGRLAIARADLMPALANAALGDGTALQVLLDLNAVDYTGSVGADRFAGAAHADALRGAAGDDTLLGGGGNDTLRGDDGNDSLDGGTGADTMTGGTGDDIYVVDHAGDAVVEEQTASGGTDTVQTSISYILQDGVEDLILTGTAERGTGNTADNRLTGSAAGNTLNGKSGDDTLTGAGGNDTLEGSNGDDSLIGGDGNDVLNGGAGADVLDGGPGTDQASYKFSAAGVEVNLTTGVAARGTATGDSLTRIEDIKGSAHGDTLTGDAGANRFYGLGGDDLLSGAAGDDWLVGENGNDTLIGSTGDDRLDGGRGSDLIQGGAGTDQASWGGSASGVGVNLATGRGHGGDAAGDTISGVENVVGSAHDDTLTGDGGNNRFFSLEGDDLIRGGGGVDRIRSGAGNDSLFGDAGDDWFDGGAGADAFDGGAGLDMVSYERGLSAVDINLSTGATAGGDAAGDTFSSIENLGGTALADRLTGNAQDNRLYGFGGNDTLRGYGGLDRMRGGDGADVLQGGGGNDWLSGGIGADRIEGGAGTDMAVYEKSATGVTVNLGAGTATRGDAAGDTFTSIENIAGSAHADILTGDDGANRLIGGGGNDWLAGGPGDDKLLGGDGDDTLSGGGGDDFMVGGAGVHLFEGGAGEDQVSYSDQDAAVTIDLDAGTSAGAAAGDRFTGVENLYGTARGDSLTGDAADNRLYGANGNDRLTGAGGIDRIYGGNGNDTIDGGADNDWFVGGSGADTFVFAPGWGQDIISDFADGSDLIHILDVAYGDLSLTQTGADVLIAHIGEDTVLIRNTILTNLDQFDFV